MCLEILSTLNPKTVQIGDTFGGHSNFSPMDIAAAMGMKNLPRAAYLLAVLKYISGTEVNKKTFPDGRAEMASELSMLVCTDWLKIAKHEGWKNKEQIVAVVNGAISEGLDFLACKTCLGSGVVRIKKTKGESECKSCDGSGNGKTTKTQRARLCGMPRQTFDSTWNDRYERVLEYMEGLELVVVNHINDVYFSSGVRKDDYKPVIL